ncbi:MAG: tRNA (adenosine(37)-N6)-dimethylallyltransferase MiaA, partial [Firmicutes bacterium]|nr:tRNA (adenosine(37)-N6)-dimethylallyltransferase MiaA [Bacillota bacterium]
EVPHHLVDFADPRQPFSAAMYRQLALAAIRDIHGRGKAVIVSGGTGLYINSLLFDMDFSAPEGDEDYRTQLLLNADGDAQRLHDRLKALDPAAAEEIHPNNVKRVLRAIERLEKGEPKLGRFAAVQTPSKELLPVLIGLTRDRTELYDRIDRRVDKLFEMGLAEELQRLMAMGLTSADISMKGIGYKEIIDAVSQGLPAEAAKDTIKLNTRHYAKRQLTWLRRYDRMKWFTLQGDGFQQPIFEEMLTYGRQESDHS